MEITFTTKKDGKPKSFEIIKIEEFHPYLLLYNENDKNPMIIWKNAIEDLKDIKLECGA